MEIKLHSSHHFHTLVIEAENVNIAEDVSEAVYKRGEDGSMQRTGYDITDNSLKQYSSVVEDLFYYRERDYNSSDLIRQAFKKLPDDVAQLLLKELTEDYGD